MYLFKLKLFKELKLIIKSMDGFYNEEEISKRLLNIIESYPKCSEAYYLLGKILRSIHYLDIAIILNKKFCDAYFLRAYLKNINNDELGTYRDLQKTLKYINRRNDLSNYQIHIIYSELGFYEKKLGNRTKAIEYYTKAINLYTDYRYYFERGCIFFEVMNYTKSIDDFNKAIELNPSHRKLYSFRAKVKKILGDEIGYQKDKELSNQEQFEFEDKIDVKA